MDYFEELKQSKDFDKSKVALARKYKLKTVPTNAELLLKGVFIPTKPVRSSSGVSVGIVLTSSDVISGSFISSNIFSAEYIISIILAQCMANV